MLSKLSQVKPSRELKLRFPGPIWHLRPNGHAKRSYKSLGQNPKVNFNLVKILWARNGPNLGQKAKRQLKVGVYLRGEPRIYWLRE
jgi:uncharacterized protein YneF (UPF0154 family)